MSGLIITFVCLVLFISWMIWEIKHAPTVREDYPDDKMDGLIDRLKGSNNKSQLSINKKQLMAK